MKDAAVKIALALKEASQQFNSPGGIG